MAVAGRAGTVGACRRGRAFCLEGLNFYGGGKGFENGGSGSGGVGGYVLFIPSYVDSIGG